MQLLDKESIILRIGDLKLSDTYDTFGKKRMVNGFSYQPIIHPDGFWYSQIGEHLAHGDSRKGVIISNEKVKLYLTYGANRLASNAQSMAVGYQDEMGFFFIDECFGDIYSEKPRLSSRYIVRCQSLFERSGSEKCIFNFYLLKHKVTLSKADKVSFSVLLSKIWMIEDAVSKSNLSNLRKKELFLKKKAEEKNATLG